MSKPHLSVVILTHNEEDNLPRCLKGIPSDYPVLIVDSGSTDRTLEIARDFGCRIYSNPWPGFATQRNFALEACGIDTPWVLFVDADEIYPEHFYTAFEAEFASSEAVDVVMVPSVLYLRGKRLDHAPGYPIYHPRLVRRGGASFITNHTGHGEAVLDSCRIVYGKIPYEHYFYHGEIIEWMHKHVDKAALEVRLKPTAGAVMTRRGRLSVWLGRSALRILARFLYHYVFRGGFLDGTAGFEFALMFSWYEASIYLQARAARAAEELGVPSAVSLPETP